MAVELVYIPGRAAGRLAESWLKAQARGWAWR
jgi:hypothetical protein